MGRGVLELNLHCLWSLVLRPGRPSTALLELGWSTPWAPAQEGGGQARSPAAGDSEDPDSSVQWPGSPLRVLSLYPLSQSQEVSSIVSHLTDQETEAKGSLLTQAQ